MGLKDMLMKPKLDKIKLLLDEITKETEKETIRIKVKPTLEDNLLKSKFGGLPYIPKNREIPRDSNGNHLLLLAQINCEELPENNIYMKKGIIQFWIKNDCVMGLDFDNPTLDKEKRVIYYPSIEEYYSIDEIGSMYKPEDDDGENYLPITEGAPLGLKFTLEREGISPYDYRFEDIFVQKWNEKFLNYQIEDIWDDKIEDVMEYVFDEYDKSGGHKIGGYPYFTQEDPRSFEKYKDYENIILQIDSEWEDDFEIIWGDAGVGSFFATKEQFDELNFEQVLYNWDCC